MMSFKQQLYYETAQLLSTIPTIIGIAIRRIFYKLTLQQCGKNFVIEYGSLITTQTTRIGDNVWIGSYAIIGNAQIHDNVMIASHTCVLSQSQGHKQGNKLVKTTPTMIYENCWIGTHCTIKADINQNTIVGAGSVVTKTFLSHQTLVGVPAIPL